MVGRTPRPALAKMRQIGGCARLGAFVPLRAFSAYDGRAGKARSDRRRPGSDGRGFIVPRQDPDPSDADIDAVMSGNLWTSFFTRQTKWMTARSAAG